MSRQNQHLVSLTVRDPATGEAKNLGQWDGLGGGGVDSEESTYRAAGGVRVSLGGSVNPENVTLRRLYDLQRDHTVVGWLINLVGRGEGTVTKQPTDASYKGSGRPLVYKGTLKRVTPPEVDSDSDEAGLIELEFTIAGTVALA